MKPIFILSKQGAFSDDLLTKSKYFLVGMKNLWDMVPLCASLHGAILNLRYSRSCNPHHMPLFSVKAQEVLNSNSAGLRPDFAHV